MILNGNSYNQSFLTPREEYTRLEGGSIYNKSRFHHITTQSKTTIDYSPSFMEEYQRTTGDSQRPRVGTLSYRDIIDMPSGISTSGIAQINKENIPVNREIAQINSSLSSRQNPYPRLN